MANFLFGCLKTETESFFLFLAPATSLLGIGGKLTFRFNLSLISWPAQKTLKVWIISLFLFSFGIAQAQAGQPLPRNTLAVEYWQKGKIDFTYTKPGFSRQSLHNVQSFSKSILTLIIGIAVEKKIIRDLDENVAPLLWPESPKKIQLSWRELLSMRSGFPSTSRSAYGAWVSQRNWVNFFLGKPQKDQKDFSYSTGDSHLLAVALEKTLPGGLEVFAKKEFFTPLGIKRVVWDRDPQGNVFGGNNLRISFGDSWKIGSLVLKQGKVDEKQILPTTWIAEMMKSHATPENEFVEFQVRGYGYLWWLVRVNNQDGSCALGYGGQFLCLFPKISAQFLLFSRIPKSAAEILPHYQEIQQLLKKLIPPAD